MTTATKTRKRTLIDHDYVWTPRAFIHYLDANCFEFWQPAFEFVATNPFEWGEQPSYQEFRRRLNAWKAARHA